MFAGEVNEIYEPATNPKQKWRFIFRRYNVEEKTKNWNFLWKLFSSPFLCSFVRCASCQLTIIVWKIADWQWDEIFPPRKQCTRRRDSASKPGQERQECCLKTVDDLVGWMKRRINGVLIYWEMSTQTMSMVLLPPATTTMIWTAF